MPKLRISAPLQGLHQFWPIVEIPGNENPAKWLGNRNFEAICQGWRMLCSLALRVLRNPALLSGLKTQLVNLLIQTLELFNLL